MCLLRIRHPVFPFPDRSALTLTVGQQISDSCTINSDWKWGKEEDDEEEREEEEEEKLKEEEGENEWEEEDKEEWGTPGWCGVNRGLGMNVGYVG